MKNRRTLPFRSVLVLLVGFVVPTTHDCLGKDSADWSTTQREVTTALMKPDTTLAALVKQVADDKPNTGQEAMFALCIISRAGIRSQYLNALQNLNKVSPQLGAGQIWNMYYYACNQQEDWDLAKALVDVFADKVGDVILENRLVKHLIESGWTDEQIDQWFSDKPSGIDNFWVKERVRFNVAQGRGAALEEQLAQRVREEPQDIAAAIAYLETLLYAHRDRKTVPDFGWFAGIIKPDRATDAATIASLLARLGTKNMAIVYYQQAAGKELTDVEVRKLLNMSQVMLGDDTVRAGFAARTRDQLAECLLSVGEAQAAQKWMIEAADLRQKYGMGINALFAGRVQSQSGARTIEGRIKGEEKASEEDPRYWQLRAAYYRGRKEPAEEEAAILKGISLTTPLPLPERTGKGFSDNRRSLIGDYAHFLARENRKADAVALLRKELAESPFTAESSEAAARLLAFDFEEYVRFDDELLWTWLENRPQWKSTEERLLWEMLKTVSREDLLPQLVRAEKLALGIDASRAFALGWIENRMQFPQRSLPLLIYAVQNTQDKVIKSQATHTLYQSYADARDWKSAEGVLPNVTWYESRELTEHYAQLAVLAAETGAKADAMRLWKRAANLDLTATGALRQLVTAGLRDELIAFYQQMQRDIPSSHIPTDVLKSLEL